MHCTRRCSPINRRRSASLKSTDSGCSSLWIPKVIPRALETTSADEEIKDHVPAMIDAMGDIKMVKKCTTFLFLKHVFFLGVHGMFFSHQIHLLYSSSCFSHYAITISVFVELMSFSPNYMFGIHSHIFSLAILQTGERWALAPTPWAKKHAVKRGSEHLNTCHQLIRMWHLPEGCKTPSAGTDAVKLQLPLLLHHLLSIHKCATKKTRTPDVWMQHCLLASAHTCPQGDGPW